MAAAVSERTESYGLRRRAWTGSPGCPTRACPSTLQASRGGRGAGEANPPVPQEECWGISGISVRRTGWSCATPVEYLAKLVTVRSMAAATPVALMPFKLLHCGIMRYDDSLEDQLGDLVFYPDSTEVSILVSETDSFLTGQPMTA